ncbi:hypothetical protein [Pseudodesulfovibrio sp. zrk46]|uniref:hypothetical protein n=1 Tax=Pseudodesulfovibrio sp. zrk46 TaxID=2725288 RepID=UPI001448AE07|nr:hypothetical protein [Pseudodesulfovibrio sp. zrk46]QJB55561.1 hypothetical protein HFN16_03740 [Pseudodesulfovibrio sp. zrk46]
MDNELKERIQALAEAQGMDSTELEQLFNAGGLPDELMEAMTLVLGSIGDFGKEQGPE